MVSNDSNDGNNGNKEYNQIIGRYMKINIDALRDTLKILGGVVKDTLDVGDYRITIIVERKIDDKNGLVVNNMVVEKRLSGLQIGTIVQRLKDVMGKI